MNLSINSLQRRCWHCAYSSHYSLDYIGKEFEAFLFGRNSNYFLHIESLIYLIIFGISRATLYIATSSNIFSNLIFLVRWRPRADTDRTDPAGDYTSYVPKYLISFHYSRSICNQSNESNRINKVSHRLMNVKGLIYLQLFGWNN